MADLIVHERVLKVDNDQRGALRIEVGEDVLRTPSSNDTLNDRGREGDAIHVIYPFSCGNACQLLRCTG